MDKNSTIQENQEIRKYQKIQQFKKFNGSKFNGYQFNGSKTYGANLMEYNSMDQLPYGLRCELLDAYGTWVTDTLDQGYTGYLTTFMFDYIPGHPRSIIGAMTKDIEQFYRTLVTRIVRKPRTAQIHQLPKLIALPDRPVYSATIRMRTARQSR